jgi:hypothetical protein
MSSLFNDYKKNIKHFALKISMIIRSNVTKILRICLKIFLNLHKVPGCCELRQWKSSNFTTFQIFLPSNGASKSGFSNSSLSQGLIQKKKSSAGHSLLEKKPLQTQFTRKACKIR